MIGRVNVAELAEFERRRHKKIDIFKCPIFNVVQICFEPGQEIPSHTEPYSVLFYVLEGTGVITANGRSWDVKTGDIIFSKKDTARGIVAKTRMRLLGVQEPH